MAASDRLAGAVRALVGPHRRKLLGALLGVALVLPFALPTGRLEDVTLVVIYGVVVYSAVLPIGYAGQLILSQGAFLGIGAYTFIKATEAGLPPVVSVGVATVVTAAVAYVLGRPATRASGIYLGIITLAFNEMFVIALTIFEEYTGGSAGVSSPDLLPEALTAVLPEELLFYYLALAVYAAGFVTFRRLLSGETGWAFLALKEDLTVAESIGIDTGTYRLRAFTVAGAVCGLGGGLFAPFNGFVSPTMFGLQRTIDIILAGILGGLTVPSGTLFGSALVILFPRLLRSVSDFRLIVYGATLIALLAYLPEGVGGWIREWIRK